MEICVFDFTDFSFDMNILINQKIQQFQIKNSVSGILIFQNFNNLQNFKLFSGENFPIVKIIRTINSFKEENEENMIYQLLHDVL